MRAKDFIREGDMHSWHKQGIPGLKSLTGVNQYYELYRFGLAMAAAGREGEKIIGDAEGTSKDNPTTVSYTQAEEDIINGGLKHIGGSATQMTSKLSAEPTDTNKQSIVGKRGPLPRRT